MADAHAKHHDYHLVNPSPWPAVGGAAAFILAVGAVNWMHGGNSAIMALGFAARPLHHVHVVARCHQGSPRG